MFWWLGETLVGWVCQRQGPISINVAVRQPPATSSIFDIFSTIMAQVSNDQVAFASDNMLIDLSESSKTTRCEEHHHPQPNSSHFPRKQRTLSLLTSNRLSHTLHSQHTYSLHPPQRSCIGDRIVARKDWTSTIRRKWRASEVRRRFGRQRID